MELAKDFEKFRNTIIFFLTKVMACETIPLCRRNKVKDHSVICMVRWNILHLLAFSSKIFLLENFLHPLIQVLRTTYQVDVTSLETRSQDSS